MIEFKHIVKLEDGIHVRTAVKLLDETKKLKCKVTIFKGKNEATTRQLITLLALAIKKNDEIVVRVEGNNEKVLAMKLQEYMEKNI